MAPKHKPNRSKGNKNLAKTIASRADIHTLYEQSVQCVEAEIDFVDTTFSKIRRRKAKVLREDFCGTASTSCEWIHRRRTNKAIAVDLDEQVLAWARNNNVAKLNEQTAKRIQLINSDVMTSFNSHVDTVLAMNFSYWVFKKRTTMVQYFKAVYDSLVGDGVFFLDAFGGYEAYKELEETTEHDGFDYVWEQADYDPITGNMLCYIHFRFKDGSKTDRAFTYEWRLWTLPEITEMLEKAGFKPTVYWEGTEIDTGEGDGIFTASAKGEADASWIVYIVAEKSPDKVT